VWAESALLFRTTAPAADTGTASAAFRHAAIIAMVLAWGGAAADNSPRSRTREGVAVTIAAGGKRLRRKLTISTPNLQSIDARAAAFMCDKDERLWRRTHLNNIARHVVANPIPDLQRDLGESR